MINNISPLYKQNTYNTQNFKNNIKNNAQIAFGSSKHITVKGTETQAKIYTDNISWRTYDQIKTICSHPVFHDVPVRIMPDAHAGKNAVVGFSAPVVNNKIIPNIISGDIGCGMLCVKIDTQGQDIDYAKLDDVIRTYVSGRRSKEPDCMNRHIAKIEPEVSYKCKNSYRVSSDQIFSTIGTLGGGNHFIEIDTDENCENYLVIHTGSRTFGKAVNSYHSEIAKEQNPYKIKDLSYLSGDEAKQYLEDMRLAVKFSQLNRRIIADEIIKRMGWKEKESFESIHNYISDDNMIRKGAISAYNGEKMIIPLNMRDGALIAAGKGNPEWNYTAPHGAGRQFSRSEASETIPFEEYKKSMEGIYTTCVSESSIDESPQAYKDSDEIIDNISDTAKIEKRIKPKFNYKD